MDVVWIVDFIQIKYKLTLRKISHVSRIVLFVVRSWIAHFLHQIHPYCNLAFLKMFEFLVLLCAKFKVHSTRICEANMRPIRDPAHATYFVGRDTLASTPRQPLRVSTAPVMARTNRSPAQDHDGGEALESNNYELNLYFLLLEAQQS